MYSFSYIVLCVYSSSQKSSLFSIKWYHTNFSLISYVCTVQLGKLFTRNNHVTLNISYLFLTLSLSMRLLCENYTGPVF